MNTKTLFIIIAIIILIGGILHMFYATYRYYNLSKIPYNNNCPEIILQNMITYNFYAIYGTFIIVCVILLIMIVQLK